MAVNRGQYFDALETMSSEERAKYQLAKLRETLEAAYNKSSAARKQLDVAGVTPDSFTSLKDLEKLPIIRKPELIEMQKANLPFGGLAMVPTQDIERIFISPGPIYEYQPSGINWFARSFHAAGFGKGDIVVNTFTYHMSPAGILFHEGLRQCGATVVVMGTGNTDALIQAMLDLKINGFLGTPTFLLSVIKKAEEMGRNFTKDFALNKTWFTGEMLTASMRKTFEEQYQLATFQAYAVTEHGGAIAYECPHKGGMHLMDDYVVEIVNPQTGKAVERGEVGEIVVTPLHNRTWGLLRFGTGDLSSLNTRPCACGRTSLKISGILGRSGDAVKVRGMFIVAKQAEQVITGFATVAKFQIVVSRRGERDEMVLKLATKDSSTDRNKLSDEINRKFQDVCRLKLDKIEYVEAATIPDQRKVIDDVRKWE
jgi:phenylacetate-CoA ligase